MRLFIGLLLLLVLYGIDSIFAQQKNTTDHKSSVVKSEAAWSKSEAESSQSATTQIVVDGITYSTTQNGIFITMPKAVGNVKLFSLTGEVVWSGNLVQGRFFIPTRAGIYFLKVNNRSYKIVCK
jgi:hypothetical protein